MGLRSLATRAWQSFGLRGQALPPLYQDGWQSALPASALAPNAASFSAYRRALDIVEGSLLSTPLLTYRNGKETPDSSAAEVIRNTPAAHWAQAYSDCFSSGNGWLQRRGDRLEAIQAARVSGYLDDDGRPYYLLDQGQQLDMATVVHLMHRNANSPYYGDSLLSAYSETAGLVSATLSIYNQLQVNGCFPELVFTTANHLTGAQMKELREHVDAQIGAAQGKAGKNIIMASGLSAAVVRRLPSALDADIVASMQFSVEEMARTVGVPLSLLSTKEVSGGYNSSIEANRAFYRATMRPLFARVEQELSRVLRAEVRFDVQELLLGVGTERSEVVSKLVHAGVLTSNEGRAAFGYGKLATGGDMPGMPNQLTPITAWENPPPAPDKQDVSIV